MIAVLPVSADTTVPVDIHDLDYDRFLEEVHSFEFWFEAVSGYLTGLTWGHRPGLVDRPRTPEERERLVTVLCNYCVGEAAALEGASGLVAIAPNRLAKVFLATQVVDEGRHLEIFYHRLRDLGVDDPESEVERRASRSLLLFRRRLHLLSNAAAAASSVFVCCTCNCDMLTLNSTIALLGHVHARRRDSTVIKFI